MELCLDQRLPVYVVNLPQGDDPDSFLKSHGPQAFQEKLQAARPAFEQFLLWLMTRTPPDSIDRRVRLMDEIVPRYRKISDPVERNLYEKEICRLLGIDPSAFRRRLAGERTEQKWSKPREPEVKLQATGPLRARDAGQETLLGILAVYPEARSEMVAIGLETIFDQTHLPLAQALLDGVDSDESGDFRWSRVFQNLKAMSRGSWLPGY